MKDPHFHFKMQYKLNSFRILQAYFKNSRTLPMKDLHLPRYLAYGFGVPLQLKYRIL